jgi:hypothetical protein
LKDKKVAFIVCSNGYGHLKRVLLVIKQLARLSDKLTIHLFCPQSHLQLAKQEINFSVNSKIHFNTDASANEISWLSPDGITIERYNEWCAELQRNTELHESNLIISDNHVAPLNIFGNVVLMGSFLWHDVATFRNHDVDSLIAREADLLSARKPNMICLGAMVMDAVRSQTNAKPVSWFCTRYTDASAVRKRGVLITGGGTALINKLLADVCVYIATHNQSEYQIFVDSKIYELVKTRCDASVKKFEFTDQEFSALATIVCRPGIGILTDCVRYSVPPFAVNDEYNEEIKHNSHRITELGIGKAITAFQRTPTEIGESILDFASDTATIESCTTQLQAQSTGGAAEAANFIFKKLMYG